MNLSVRDTGNWQHTLDIEVPAEEVEQKLDQAARHVQMRASLPGFRRGKVPLDMVRQNFADTVEQEFLESFVPSVTGRALEQSKLNPVVPPLVRNLRFTPGQPLRFEAIVEVAPRIEARDYRGIPIARRAGTISGADLERVLGELREESAVFLDIARPAERGDVVLLDSTRLDANGRRLTGTRAKGARIQLGAPDLLPDLENGLLGAEAGQERTLEVGYPADYASADLAGKRVRYVVRVRKIQEKKLRELDDNFAKDVFGLESIAALRERVRRNLEAEEAARVQREVEAGLAEELIRRNSFELPERLVNYMLERVIREATGGRTVRDELLKELEQRYRPGVTQSLKREVLLGAVAVQEKIEVSEDEVAAELDRLAQSDPRQASRVRARYQAAERRQALRETLVERKALERLIQLADVRSETAGENPLIVPASR